VYASGDVIGDPELKTVAAKEDNHAVENTDDLVQFVKHRETDEIVGVHMVGWRAADMIMEATLAVKFRLTVDDSIGTAHPFSTFSEAFKRACQAFRRDTSTTSGCAE